MYCVRYIFLEAKPLLTFKVPVLGCTVLVWHTLLRTYLHGQHSTTTRASTISWHALQGRHSTSSQKPAVRASHAFMVVCDSAFCSFIFLEILFLFSCRILQRFQTQNMRQIELQATRALRCANLPIALVFGELFRSMWYATEDTFTIGMGT